MNKKYDNNLQEIKNTIPIKTFSTNSMEIEEDKENSIYKLTTTFLTQFYDAKEKYLIDSLLQDMQENKEKYKGLTIIPVEREKIVELLNKGKDFDQLQQQLAEKDKEIERLKQGVTIREQVEAIIKKETDNIKKQITKEITPIIYKECRHEICKNIREKAFPYYYLGRVIGHIINIELLDEIEKGTDNE